MWCGRFSLHIVTRAKWNSWTYVRRNDLVLRQHTVDRRAQACRYDLLRRVSEDVVDGEVGRDALADFPALDLFAHGDDLARALEADRAVVTAAIDDPQLRALARRWSDRMIGFLVPDYGVQRATAASVFIDGVLWHARIHDQPLDATLIEGALAGILGTESTTTSD